MAATEHGQQLNMDITNRRHDLKFTKNRFIDNYSVCHKDRREMISQLLYNG